MMYSNCLHQRLHVLYFPSDHSEKDTGLDSSKNVKVMIFQPEEEYHEYSSSFLCQKIRCYYAVSAAELRPSTS